MKPGSDAPKDTKGLRTGFTTGACAAAAAKAATRALVQGTAVAEISSRLPNGQAVTFPLASLALAGEEATASIIKDGGDDPDCTHGAEIVAKVTLSRVTHGVRLAGGAGVAVVTRPGLGLEVGGPAINPVPRQNITAMVVEELAGTPFVGADVVISVPDGEERAKKTLNARLGLLGGISILGTTGIVVPYSTAAFVASVVQAVNLAAYQGVKELVFTTGGRSETYAMRLLPELPEAAFIQVGDYIGIGLKNAVRHSMTKVHIVAMMGKLSKMANGKMMTHASASEVNMELLADLAAELGCSQEIAQQIRNANTARHVLEIAAEQGLGDALTELICRRAAEVAWKFARNRLAIGVTLVDFGGAVLARWDLPAVGGAGTNFNP